MAEKNNRVIPLPHIRQASTVRKPKHPVIRTNMSYGDSINNMPRVIMSALFTLAKGKTSSYKLYDINAYRKIKYRWVDDKGETFNIILSFKPDEKNNGKRYDLNRVSITNRGVFINDKLFKDSIISNFISNLYCIDLYDMANNLSDKCFNERYNSINRFYINEFTYALYRELNYGTLNNKIVLLRKAEILLNSFKKEGKEEKKEKINTIKNNILTKYFPFPRQMFCDEPLLCQNEAHIKYEEDKYDAEKRERKRREREEKELAKKDKRKKLTLKKE